MSEKKPEYDAKVTDTVQKMMIERDIALLRQTIGLPAWINSLSDEQYEAVNEIVATWLTYPQVKTSDCQSIDTYVKITNK